MSKELLQRALDALNSSNFPERTAAVRVLESALERQKQPEQLAVSDAEAKVAIEACYMFYSPDLVRDMRRALEAFAASRAMPATQGAPAASQAAQLKDAVPLSDEQIESEWRALQTRRSMQARKILEERIGLSCPRCKSGKLKIDSNGYNEFMRCQSCRQVPPPLAFKG
jgi:hypothetical protein